MVENPKELIRDPLDILGCWLDFIWIYKGSYIQELSAN